MLFDMRLGRFPGMVHRMFVMTPGQVRVMRSGLMFSCFMVLRGLLVVSCRVFVMLCCLVMMLCCFLRHKFPPNGCRDGNRVRSSVL